jgi:hypothetical protein
MVEKGKWNAAHEGPKWRQVDFPGGGLVGVSIGEYSEQVMQILPKATIHGIVLLNS